MNATQKNTAFFTLIAMTLLLLSGCASFERSSSEQTTHAMSWKQRSTALNQITAWHLNGSVSIQHDEKADLASLAWDQQLDQYQFGLFGPLGFGKINITGSPGIITLVQSGKSPISAPTPESLMQSQLGWYVPISNLYYWTRGLPAPKTAAKMTFDANHRLINLQQDNWTVNYLDYKPVGALDLPSKMAFSTPQLKIKLAVKSWILQ